MIKIVATGIDYMNNKKISKSFSSSTNKYLIREDIVKFEHGVKLLIANCGKVHITFKVTRDNKHPVYNTFVSAMSSFIDVSNNGNYDRCITHMIDSINSSVRSFE